MTRWVNGLLVCERCNKPMPEESQALYRSSSPPAVALHEECAVAWARARFPSGETGSGCPVGRRGATGPPGDSDPQVQVAALWQLCWRLESTLAKIVHAGGVTDEVFEHFEGRSREPAPELAPMTLEAEYNPVCMYCGRIFEPGNTIRVTEGARLAVCSDCWEKLPVMDRTD